MVETGLDVLLNSETTSLAGARVGVLANQASVTRSGDHIAHALVHAGVNVVALFGPEHGVLGTAQPGAHVSDSLDEQLRVPVYSLYGEQKSPSAESLENIDVMLIDLQDVGARFYTYTSTMANVMTACGKRSIPVVVLDRPNPITGLDPEGPVLDPGYASFVGMFPIPIRHAMTIGELARLFVEHFGVICQLRVVPMRGWKRRMFYNETGCRWVKPSPSMVEPDTALYYPGTCLLEGTNVSEGRGTAYPFKIIGATWIGANALCDALRSYALPGLDLHPVSWHAEDANTYQGVQLSARDRRAFRPVYTGVAILCALRALHPHELEFRKPKQGERHFIDLLAGTSALREAIESGLSPWEIAAQWEPGVSRFANMASDILIYPDEEDT